MGCASWTSQAGRSGSTGVDPLKGCCLLESIFRVIVAITDKFDGPFSESEIRPEKRFCSLTFIRRRAKKWGHKLGSLPGPF